MKGKQQKKVLIMLCLLSVLHMIFSMTTTVYAEKYYNPLHAEIPYKHIYTTADPTADSIFHYIITAKENAPLPSETSENGSFIISGVSSDGVKNGNNTIFELRGKLTFTFTRPGIYVYEIWADAEKDGKKINTDCYSFESDIKTVTFCISNADGNELKFQGFTIENEKDEKLKEITFAPEYKVPIKTVQIEKSDLSDNAETVMTGENSYVRQYAVLTAVSGAGIVILTILRKKGRAEDV